MTPPPTPKEALLAEILEVLLRIEERLTPAVPVATWRMERRQPVVTWHAESHTAHRGPAGEHRVGWQTPPHGYMHGGWVHK